MNKINSILIGIILLLAGAGIGYTMSMSDGHDEEYLKDTAKMMKDEDSVMMKEMYDLMTMNGKMMQEKGTQYSDSELTSTGKTAVEKAVKLDEMSKEMVKRGDKLMGMME